jgi:segregation and condensation protein A
MSSFVVKVGEFAGPIELLLNLIEERRLHISQVSLAAVADDFVAFVDQIGESADKNVLANFIWTAATLMLIKSVALLPNLEITPEEKSNVEELELRLKLYQQFKDLSEQVKDIFGKQFIFAREANKEATRVFVPSSEINLAGISEAMSAVLRSLPVAEKVPQVVVQKVISLEEMIESLKDRMTRAIKMSFKDFVGDKKEKVNVIISFLGMLELVKRGLIRAEQGSHFSDITMEQTELDVPRYL